MANPEPRRILVLRNSHVGDMILATPLLRDLRRCHPKAHITVATGAWCVDVLQENPWINEILVLNTPWGNHKLNRSFLPFRVLRFFLSPNTIAPLRRGHYDVGIDVSGHPLNAFLLWLARIPFIVGTRTIPGKHPFLAETVWHAQGEPAISSIQKILSVFGFQPGSPEPELFLREEEILGIRSRLQNAGISAGKPFTVIAPGAGWPPSKCWLPDRFGKTAQFLLEKARLPSVIIGSPDEKTLTARVAREGNPSSLDWGGLLSLRECMALISQASLVLCNNSSALHMARAFRVPVVVICGGHYGGVEVQKRCWGYPTECVFLGSRRSDCHIRCNPTCATQECMLETHPDQVVQAGLDLLKARGIVLE